MENTNETSKSLPESAHQKVSLIEESTAETTDSPADCCDDEEDDANACGDNSFLKQLVKNFDGYSRILGHTTKEEPCGGSGDSLESFPTSTQSISTACTESPERLFQTDVDFKSSPIPVSEVLFPAAADDATQSDHQRGNINKDKEDIYTVRKSPLASIPEEQCDGSGDSLESFLTLTQSINATCKGTPEGLLQGDADSKSPPSSVNNDLFLAAENDVTQSDHQGANINKDKRVILTNQELQLASLPELNDNTRRLYQTEVYSFSKFWRKDEEYGDKILSKNGTIFLKENAQEAKHIRDWSTAVEDDYIVTKRTNFNPDADKSSVSELVWENKQNDSIATHEDSNFNCVGDNTMKTGNTESPRSDASRVVYTRDYLLKFCDCILAYAFPEGLRQFTPTGQLPLKQLEFAQEARTPYVPKTYNGMEHLMFYNDMHFISNSKRSTVKF